MAIVDVPGTRLGMVTGDNQSTAVWAVTQLDAVSRARAVPIPVRRLYGRGDFLRRSPSLSVIFGTGKIDPPRVFARSRDNLVFLVVATIPVKEQPDNAGLLIDHRTRISACVALIVPNDILSAPVLAAVGRAFQEHINFSGVVRGVPSALAECQHRPPFGHNQRGNAVGMVAVGAADEQVDSLRAGRGCCTGVQRDQKRQQTNQESPYHR